MIDRDRFCESCVHSGVCMYEKEMRKIRGDVVKFINNDSVEVMLSCKRFCYRGIANMDMNWADTVRGLTTDRCCAPFPHSEASKLKGVKKL